MIWYVLCGDAAGDDGVDAFDAAAEVSWFWSTECETSEVFFHHSFLQLVWEKYWQLF